MKKHAAKIISALLLSHAAYAAELGDVLENISGVNQLLSPDVTGCVVKTSPLASRCSDPYEAVCKNSITKSTKLEASKDHIREQALKNAGYTSQTDPTDELLKKIEELQKKRLSVLGKPEEASILKSLVQAEKRLLAIMADSEKQVEGQLHVSQASFRANVEKIKGQVETQVGPAMQAQISVIKLRTPLSMADENPKTVKEQDHFDQEFQIVLDLCGVEGMVDNAQYFSWSNEIMVCPGSLMPGLASGRGITALTWTLGHELGHSVDPNKTNIPKIDSYYSDFLACVNKNYGKDFPPPSQVRNQLKKGIPRLKVLLAKIEAETPDQVGYIANVKRQIRLGEESIEDLSQTKDVRGDVSHSYRAELVGDFFGDSRLAEALGDLHAPPSDDRWSEVVASLDDFCPGTPSFEKINQMKWGGLPDGEHPADHYRIEQAMHNPKIRELLGCPKLTELDQPWCGIKGEER